jgi:YegS/Rv2252/BmrU family lipid kinase
MSKVRLIFNPLAARSGDRRIQSVLREAVPPGDDFEWVETTEPGHATRLAREAACAGYQRVIALGGDGTAHEVINGLLLAPPEKRSLFGLVPLGSCDDLAFATGLARDPLAALRLALGGDGLPLDIGRIQDATGRQAYFHNTLGMLFDAAIVLQTAGKRKTRRFLMYFTAVLRAIAQNFHVTRLHITENGTRETHDCMLFSVCNGPREGGGFKITPAADPSDGQFDFIRVGDISRLTMLRVLIAVLLGTHGRGRHVTLGRLNHIEVESEQSMPIHLDGEVWADYDADVRHIEVTLIPGAIQMVR